MSKLSFVILLVAIISQIFVVTSYAEETNNKPRKELRKEMQEDFKEKREDFMASLSAKREEMKEEFKTRREEFKKKLDALKDARKKMIVERVDQNLSDINKNATNRMSDSLKKLETMLGKLKTKAAELKAAGKDTATVDSAITAAETAITAAKAAVTAQAGKEYIANITDETKLRETIGAVKDSLKTDLETTHTTVKNAKEAVIKVARELAKLHETISPTITP